MERNTIRRCRRCQAPAIIIVNRWDARLFGILPMRNSGKTDHQCQSCGARFSLRPRPALWFVLGALSGTWFIGIGTLALLAAPVALAMQGAGEFAALMVVGTVSLAAGLGGLYYWAGPQIHAWRNPLAPGAKMPELRLGPAEHHRLCHCGAPSFRIRQRAQTIIRYPAGTEDTYLCSACSTEFTVPDRWLLAAWCAMALFFGATAAFLASLMPLQDLRGDHFFVLGVLGVGALIGALLAAQGAYQRVRHPVA